MEFDLHGGVLVSGIAVGRSGLEYDQKYCGDGIVKRYNVRIRRMVMRSVTNSELGCIIFTRQSSRL